MKYTFNVDDIIKLTLEHVIKKLYHQILIRRKVKLILENFHSILVILTTRWQYQPLGGTTRVVLYPFFFYNGNIILCTFKVSYLFPKMHDHLTKQLGYLLPVQYFWGDPLHLFKKILEDVKH